MYDDSIHVVSDGTDTVLNEFGNNVQMADINLRGNIVRTEETSTGIFSAKTNVILTNINNGLETQYEVNNVVKKLVCNEQITALNLGNEAHFIDLNGWIDKRYTSSHEIKDIVLGTSVAGIIYRDKIKIITI